MFFEHLPEDLKRSAYSLEAFGANEFAWNYEEVKKVILYISNYRYAILGGDVWKKENTDFELTYDNWYINYDNSVSWEEYIEKSKTKALNYIDFYHQRNGDSYYYAPVASLVMLGKPKRK